MRLTDGEREILNELNAAAEPTAADWQDYEAWLDSQPWLTPDEQPAPESDPINDNDPPF